MSVEVDPRVARTREVVLSATVEELTVSGFERISIDAVAERSGVARSTIYRNWPDRTTLLAEAFNQICGDGPAEVPPSDTLAGDLEALARLLVAKLTSDAWTRTVPSLIGAATHDPAMRAMMSAFSAERRAEASAMLSRAIERGEIVPSDHLDQALERFVAPFFYRALMSQQPLDQAFIDAQVVAAIGDLAAR